MGSEVKLSGSAPKFYSHRKQGLNFFTGGKFFDFVEIHKSDFIGLQVYKLTVNLILCGGDTLYVW